MASKPHLQSLEASEQQRRLSRDDLLRSRIIEKQEYIHSLEGEITIRSMSVRTRREIRTKAGWGTPEFDEEVFNTWAIIYSVVDPKLTEEDVEAISEQEVAVFEEILLKLSLLNMLGRGEDLKKDSEPTESSDSPSDSASDSA